MIRIAITAAAFRRHRRHAATRLDRAGSSCSSLA
jgi:hypothetical protein